MTLRAEPGQNPVLSVSTDAMLRAIDTSFLVNGDYLWSDQSGGYIFLQNSTLALSSTVFATANSNGGALPGRLVFNGFGPIGPVPPTPTPPLTFTVPDYSALDALAADTIGAGQLLVVTNQDSQWILKAGDATTIAATSDVNMIRTANTTTPNTKYWERLPIGSASWWQERFNAEGAVFIDSDVGADDAVGSSTDPLQSVDELNRRIQGVNVDQFFNEISLTGAEFIMKYPFRPLFSPNQGFGGMEFVGTMTLIGSGALTSATSFNQATNASQQYAATIAGQPLSAYISGYPDFYRLGDDPTPGSGTEGWIVSENTDVPGTVYCPTWGSFNVRASIPNGTTIYVHRIATVGNVDQQQSFEVGAEGFVEFDFLGFQSLNTSNSEGIELNRCGVNFGISVTGSSITYVTSYVDRVFFSGSPSCGLFNCSVKRTFQKIDADVTLAACTLFIVPNTGAPHTIQGGGPDTIFDLEMRGNTGAGLPAIKVKGAIAAFKPVNAVSAWFWGGAVSGGAGIDIGCLCDGSGTFVSYPDATKMTIAVNTAIARLTSNGGVNTDAANIGALGATGIRNSNAFIGFTN